MNKFENEYRDLIQEDMPDLWDRIEAGLVEKPVVQEGTVGQREEETKLKKNVVSRTNRPHIYKFVKYAGVAVAACILFVLVMPTALGMLATGGASESAKSAQNDMAAVEAPAAAMPESAMESAKMEAPAMEGAVMEAAPTEGAAPMEDAIEEGVREEAEITEGIAEPSAGKTEAKASKKVSLEDGTILENLQVNILEIENMNYHTIYRACVEVDETGTFQTGDVIEFISTDVVAQENESNKGTLTGGIDANNTATQAGGDNAGSCGTGDIMIGETITVTLSYDADADISLHLIQ